MMNWAEQWGIKHLSPSSLNAWRDNPAAFVAGYCFGIWNNEPIPPAWRGTAVEGGLAKFLHGASPEEAIEAAKQTYELEAQGLADEIAEKQRELTPRIAAVAIEAAKELELPRPTATQLRLEYRLDGIEVPIIGYPDFIFEDYCLDLKTSERCPKDKPNPAHAMQASLYARARGERRADLLYVTHTKWNLFSLDENDIAKHMADLNRLAKAVRAVLSKAKDKNDLAIMCPPDFSHYRWSDEPFVKRVQSEIEAWR